MSLCFKSQNEISEDQNDILIFHQFFQKAIPKTEGDKRFVHCIASNESLDLDNERVLSEALRKSSDYFLAKGNVDIDHLTKIGHRMGIKHPHLFEIGVPREVKSRGKETMVKAEIYRGEGQSAENANIFWDSMTNQKPAQRWFPSVAGGITDQGKTMEKGEIVNEIRKVRWSNLGFAKEPVNQHLPEVSLQQITKSLCLIDMSKTLTAGNTGAGGEYATDVAKLEGGAAVRQERLDRKRRFIRITTEIKKGQFFTDLGSMGDIKLASLIVFYRAELGMSSDEARLFAKGDYAIINDWRQKNAA